MFEAKKLSYQSFTYPDLSTRPALPDKKNHTDQAWGHSFCNGDTDLRTENEEGRKEEESLPILSQSVPPFFLNGTVIPAKEAKA